MIIKVNDKNIRQFYSAFILTGRDMAFKKKYKDMLLSKAAREIGQKLLDEGLIKVRKDQPLNTLGERYTLQLFALKQPKNGIIRYGKKK